MRRVKRPAEFTPMEIAMGLCLVAAVAYTLYLIFTLQSPYHLTSDPVNELQYMRLSWEQKTLFPKGYVCGQESLSTRPVLLYWLFYAITHKFLLSGQLVNVCSLLLELAAIYYFLTKLKVSRSVKFFSLFLVIAFLVSGREFAVDEETALSVTLAFVTLALRLSLKEAETTRDRVRLGGLILLLTAVFNYGTIKMILYLYFPLAALDVGRPLYHYFFKRTPTERAERAQCAVSIAALGVNVLSYVVFVLRHSDFITRPVTTIVGMDRWFSWDILSSQLLIIFKCFGITNAMSLHGLWFVLCAVIAGIELVSILWLLCNGSKQAKEFLGYTALATVGIIAFHVLCGMTATTRYYLVPAICLRLVCGCAISEWMEKGEKVDIKPLATAAAIVALFLGARATLIAQEDIGTPTLAQVADYAVENGYQYAVGGFWNTGVLAAYSDGRLETWHSDGLIPSSIVTFTPHRWLVNTDLFTQERLGERGLLVLTDLEEQTILEDNSYAAILLNEYAQKVQEIDTYDLYAVTENPYTLIEKIKQKESGGLPTADQTEKTALPGDVGFILSNGAALNENGELVSDGTTGGTILYGPYSESVPGVYDITLNYTVESTADASEGIFDVALDTLSCAATTFAADQTSATLEDVSIEGGHQFEARVAIPAGMVIRVQSIHYARVG